MARLCVPYSKIALRYIAYLSLPVDTSIEKNSRTKKPIAQDARISKKANSSTPKAHFANDVLVFLYNSSIIVTFSLAGTMSCFCSCRLMAIAWIYLLFALLVTEKHHSGGRSRRSRTKSLVSPLNGASIRRYMSIIITGAHK